MTTLIYVECFKMLQTLFLACVEEAGCLLLPCDADKDSGCWL